MWFLSCDFETRGLADKRRFTFFFFFWSWRFPSLLQAREHSTQAQTAKIKRVHAPTHARTKSRAAKLAEKHLQSHKRETLSGGDGSCKWHFVYITRMWKMFFCMAEALIKWDCLYHQLNIFHLQRWGREAAEGEYFSVFYPFVFVQATGIHAQCGK